MSAITIMATLVILGATLLITGFSVTSSAAAQMTGDNATMSGNMTGGNATGGNTTGSISSTDDGGFSFGDGDDGGNTIEGNGGGTGGDIAQDP